MGGLALLISISLASFFTNIPGWIVSVFLLVGVVGVIDDLVNLKQSHKVFLTILVSMPVLFNLERNFLVVFNHKVYLGIFAIIFLWLYVPFVANLVNLLAGFNGLEVGLSSIILFALFVLSKNMKELALIGFFAGLGFLIWNKYPAKVFPGDTGTLSLGALIGLVTITSGLETQATILLLPHIIDFLLKMKVRFKGKSIGKTKVLEDGTLLPPPYTSFLGIMIRALNKVWRATEPRLVLSTWLVEMLLALLVIALL